MDVVDEVVDGDMQWLAATSWQYWIVCDDGASNRFDDVDGDDHGDELWNELKSEIMLALYDHHIHSHTQVVTIIIRNLFIFISFGLCAILSAFLNYLDRKMQSHKGCIWLP